MIKVFNKDNLVVLDDLLKNNQKFKIVYLDPPYNTGNKFNYNDKIKQEEWVKNIEERLLIVKKLLLSDGCVIFSISEESLMDSLILLNKHFNFVYPPFVWLTKSELNQNKVNSVNSVVHEYILIASDNKIETNLEKIEDENLIKTKYENYPLTIKLSSNYEYIEENGKQYLKFDLYKINKDQLESDLVLMKELKDKYNLNLENQIFQKRTVQTGHGSQRYYDGLKQLKNFNKESLYVLLNVKDKNGLNGKFLLNNNYFQSIRKNEIKAKIPSFLGGYQPGLKNFQTAKPVELMKRLFCAFSNEMDDILDVYSGSGNVLKAIKEINRNGIGIEIDKDKTLSVLKKNLKNVEIEIIE